MAKNDEFTLQLRNFTFTETAEQQLYNYSTLIEFGPFIKNLLTYFKHNNSIILQIMYPFTNGSAVSVKVKFLNSYVNSSSFSIFIYF